MLNMFKAYVNINVFFFYTVTYIYVYNILLLYVFFFNLNPGIFAELTPPPSQDYSISQNTRMWKNVHLLKWIVF